MKMRGQNNEHNDSQYSQERKTNLRSHNRNTDYHISNSHFSLTLKQQYGEHWEVEDKTVINQVFHKISDRRNFSLIVVYHVNKE